MLKIITTIFSLFLLCQPVFSQTAEEYLKLGIKNIDENKYDLAEKNLNEALKINPNLLDVYIKLGNLYSITNRRGKAIEYYEKALKIDSKLIEAYNKLGSLYSENKDNYKKSLEYYKKSLDLDKSSNNIARYEIVDIADSLALDKKYDFALNAYKYLLEKIPNYSLLNSKLAEFYIRTNNKNEFNFYLDKSISLTEYENQTNLDNVFSIADLLIENKRIDDAIILYNKLIKKQPLASDAYSNLGVIYTKKHKFAESDKYFKKALVVFPNNEMALYHIALDYLEQIKIIPNDKKNYEKIREKIYKADEVFRKSCLLGFDLSCEMYEEEVEKLLKKYKSAKPSANDLLRTGIINLEDGNLEKAEIDLKQSIKLNPKIALTYSKLGNVYREKGKKEFALDFYNKAIKIDPKFSDPYNNIGVIYANKEDNKNALIYFTKALELNKNDDLIKDNITKIKLIIADKFLDENNFKEASNIYGDLIVLNPKISDYYARRAYCYSQLNEFNNSEIYFKQALKIEPDNALTKYFMGLDYIQQVKFLKNDILSGKKYDLNDIKNKINLAEKNLFESCQLDLKEACDVTGISELKNYFKIETSKEESKDADGYFKLGKEQYEKKDFEKSIKNLKKAFELSNKESKTKELLLKVMFDYSMNLYDQNKKEDGKKILDERNNIAISSHTKEENEFFAFILNIDKVLTEKKYDLIISKLENVKNEELQDNINEILLKAYVGKIIELQKEKNIDNKKYLEIFQKTKSIFDKVSKNSEEYIKLEPFINSIELFIDMLVRNDYINTNTVKLIEGKKYSESEKELSEIISKDSKNFVAYSELGLIKARLGKIDEGITLIKKAIELNPKDYISYYNLSIVYMIKKDNKKAIDNLKESIKIKPFFKSYIVEKIIVKKDTDFETIIDEDEFREIF